jgi:catechol 2,3-dioxygenase
MFANASYPHVQLRVADLERSLAFYRDLLGFRVMREDGRTLHLAPRNPTLDTGPGTLDVATLTLREVPSLRHRPRHPRTAGLSHVAWLVPSRPDLARALQGLSDARYPLTGAADHAVSESLYLDDPDGNGVEIYADRPRDQWRWDNGRVHMTVDPLDIDGLLAGASGAPGGAGGAPDLQVRGARAPWQGLPARTAIGHVHFTVSDIGAATALGQKDLGMDVTLVTPTLVGLSVDRYHHHVNLNTWAGEGAPRDDPAVAGLDSWVFRGRTVSGSPPLSSLA